MPLTPLDTASTAKALQCGQAPLRVNEWGALRRAADYHRVMDRNGRNVSRVSGRRKERRKEGSVGIRRNEPLSSPFCSPPRREICTRGTVQCMSVDTDIMPNMQCIWLIKDSFYTL